MGATRSGTESYFMRYPLTVPSVEFGRIGWQVSPVGFGGYRITDGNAIHEESLRLALVSGANLIDTSTNYANGGSERLVGKVLKDLFDAGMLSREQVVVVTKAGYVQGDNLVLAQHREQQEKPFPGMTKVNEDCWHCISPEFLDDQISRSIERLGLEQIDVLLLHNPEYYLKANGEHGEYYRRLEIAFRFLETQVEKGRIQYYGVSSNTFPEPREAQDYSSLESMIEIAESIREDHHFAVIQFPLNLFEPGAALEENNSGRTVIDLAQSHGIATLINRPLNAFAKSRLIRLADFPPHFGVDVLGNLRASLSEALETESRYPGSELIPIEQVAWGHIVKQHFVQIANPDAWKFIRHEQAEPSLKQALDELEKRADCREWAIEYRDVAKDLFDAMSVYLESQASSEAVEIAAAINDLCPELETSKTLSQKVIRLYRSLPGVTSILVGMREPRYVRDTLTLAPALPGRRALETLSHLARGLVVEE